MKSQTMFPPIFQIKFILLILLFVFQNAQAADVIWTNIAGGNWSNTSNWSTGQTPGPADTAHIVLDGNYIVTVDTPVSIGDLVVGATSGTQQLNIEAQLNTSAVSINNNGAVVLKAEQIVSVAGIQNNGILSGEGTLVGDLTNNGQLIPIATTTANMLLTINGNFTQTSSAFLSIDIMGTSAGTEYGQLQVNQGRVDLAGMLLLSTSNNYVPVANDVFDFIVTDGDGVNDIFSNFTSESTLGLTSDLFWYKDYTQGNAKYLVEVKSAPSEIILSNNLISENSDIGTVVGNFSVLDSNSNDQHNYQLLNNANSRFIIVNNQLAVLNNSLFDFETTSSHDITVRVTDSSSLSFDKTFTIMLSDVNESPTNILLSENSIEENTDENTVIATLSTVDIDANDQHNYQLVDTASGAFVVSGNQVLVADSTLLDFESNPTLSITVRTTDNGGETFEKTFVIGLIDVDESLPVEPGVISFALENESANEDVGQISVVLTRTGGSGGVLEVDIEVAATSSTIPADYALSAQKIVWADGDASDKILSITINDDSDVEPAETLVLNLLAATSALGEFESYQLTISDNDTVVNPSPNSDPLVIATTVLPNGQEAVPYNTNISVSAGSPPYQVSWTAEVPGLTFTELGIEGTPTTPGNYVVSVSISDASNATPTTQEFNLYVAVAGMVITTAADLNAIAGAEYSQQLEVIGGKGPYEWQDGNGLPEGISLLKSGLLTGVTNKQGSYSLSVTVTDLSGQVASQAFNLDVQDVSLINITPALPVGQVNINYQVPILVTGGSEPYTCVTNTSDLPQGVQLTNCRLNGKPTAAGTYDFTITVSDASTIGLTLQVPMSMKVLSGQQAQQAVKLDPVTSIDESEIEELASRSPGESYTDEIHTNMTTDAFGNQYLVGHAYNGESYDIHLIKYDVNRVKAWHQVFNSGAHDYVYGVAVSPAQDVYVGGYRLEGNVYKGLLIKYNSIGVIQWQKTYTNSSQVDTFYNLAADETGVYAVGEFYNGVDFDASIVKYSPIGDVLWKQTYLSDDNDTAYTIDLMACEDRNETCQLFVAGAQGPELRNGWVAKISPTNGEILLTHSMSDLPIKSLRFNHQGQLILGGNLLPFGWQINAFETDFTEIWQTQYTSEKTAGLRGIAIDRDDVAYAVGYANNGKNEDAMLILVGPDGSLLDDLRIDKGADERINGVVIDANHRLVISGQRKEANSSRFLLIKIDYGKALQ